jgi:hypothetical protein
MIKLDKGRLFAVLLAAMAVAALTGSATASATVWKDGGKEVTTEFKLGLTGAANYEISSGEGGVNCTEKMTLKSTGKSNASISEFKDESCKGVGTLGTCTVQSWEAVSLPWGVTLEATKLTVTSMHVKHTMKTGCATKEINETLNVTLTPNSTSSISSFELLGTSGTYRQVASYEIEGTNKGTYGIG